MSSRRDAQRSDQTEDSWTSSLEDSMERTLQLEDRLQKEAEETLQDFLRRLLSTKSAISTSSSFAERQQALIGCRAPVREIGVGSLGKVFEQPGTPWAFKVCLIDRTGKLWNNYIMHLQIQQSFDALGNRAGEVEIPRMAWFADKRSQFWNDNLELFPNDPTFPRQPREILCMERIFPLPEPVRNAIIELFCPADLVESAKKDPANKDCLIRLHLGRKRFGLSRPGGSKFFSLRNYKFHIDQMQDLNLVAEEYAVNMADALATLHWHTKLDANDIEFVLGSTPVDRNAIRRELPARDVERLAPGTSTFEHINASPNFKKRAICLWAIDFDACSPIIMDKSGVRQAVKAFIEANHYCPRPVLQDPYTQNLWKIFYRRYISTSRQVLHGTSIPDLGALFIQAVADELKGLDQRRQLGGSGLPPANQQRDRNRRGKEHRGKGGR